MGKKVLLTIWALKQKIVNMTAVPGKMPCLGISVISSIFVTAALQ